MLWFVAFGHAALGLEWVEPPTTDDGSVAGRIRIRDGSDGASSSGLQLTFDGTPATKRELVPASRKGITTYLAFDGSGSFRAHHDKAFDLADTYAANRLQGESIGAVVFGQTAKTWPAAGEEDGIRLLLKEARSEGAVQQETRLAASIRAAVDQVAAERPLSAGGLRRLVVFTDAGEGGRGFPVEEVAEHARTVGVTVDAIVFVRPGARNVAEDLDRLARLVALTGGDVLEVAGDQVPVIENLPSRSSQLWDVSASWCGSRAPMVSVIGPEGLHTEAVALTGALTPCVVIAPLEAPKSRIVEPAELPGKASGLVCLVLAFLGLGALGLLAIWAAKRAAIPAASPLRAPSPPKPPPVLPPPESIPDEPTPDRESQPFTTNLPETHLEVVGGDLPLGTRWRFAGRILRLGANEEDNEAVVNLPQISSRHARFELAPDGTVFVEDLGSANGTWVGRDRLRPGEKVRVPPSGTVSLSSQVQVMVRQPNAAVS